MNPQVVAAEKYNVFHVFHLPPTNLSRHSEESAVHLAIHIVATMKILCHASTDRMSMMSPIRF